MMRVKQSILQGTLKRPKMFIGILLMAVVIGASGCSASKATSAQATTPGQSGQGQRVRNPAQQAAMEIRRLQSDPQNVLTSEQKVTMKPFLEELIKTPNPSQEVLQQKADAMNAVLTEPQKSYLATQKTTNGGRPSGNSPSGNSPNPNSPNGNNSTGNSTNGNNPQGGSAAGGKQNGGAYNPQDIYQQVLDSLK